MDSVCENIWSFLYFSGYLKVQSVVFVMGDSGEETVYSLAIPNIEVRSCYKSVIMEYFNKYNANVNHKLLFDYLLIGDAKSFSEEITNLLQKSISFYDNNENFYRGLVLGLLDAGASYKIE